MPLAHTDNQGGAALIVSMIVLLVLTLIGVSSLTNSNLESRMAHNFQLGNYVFQGAESAIQESIQLSTQNSPLYIEANDRLKTALEAGINIITPIPNDPTDDPDGNGRYDYNPDPAGHLGAATMTAESTVEHQGASLCRGSSAGTVSCELFDIISTASIANTGANTAHRQGIMLYIPAPN